MGVNDMGIEQGVVVEQQPKRPDLSQVPSQEVATPQPRQVNLEVAYKTELDKYKAEQLTPQQRTWEILERRAAETEPWYLQEAYEGYKPRQVSVAERLRRQALSLQARVEGVRDINQFQQLVDYFESTVTERESVYLKLPKGLSEERKKQEREKWAAKGYTSNHYFDEYDKYTSFSPKRQVPLRLKREQVKVLKGLMSSVNNPVEIAEGLRKIGFHFSEYPFSSGEQVAKLAQLFSAPHAREAIEAAQRVKHWNNEWFANTGGYGQRATEIGQIDFLIQLAQNPDPQAVLPDELVQKINVISGAMKQRVGVAEIERFKTIADNPDYLELASVISQYEGSYYRDGFPTFENMQALDQAGVLKPLVALRHAGIAIGDDSLKALFDSYEARDKPQEVRQQVIARLQEQLSDSEVQAFLQDPTKQEFVGVIANITGHPLHVNDLQSLETLFGEGLSKKNEAVYLVKLLYGGEERKYRPDLNLISGIIRHGNALSAFTDQEFPRFLEDLRTKAGFRPSNYDLFVSSPDISKIADVFNNPEMRQGITQDSTLEIIKALHPQGTDVDLYKPEYYIRLAQNPNTIRAIDLLKDLGCQFGGFNNLPDADMIEDIANSPDSQAKLASPEMKGLASKLREEFRWKTRSYEIPRLLEIYDDKDIQQQLFAQDNLEFVKKMRPNGLSLSEAKSLLMVDPPTRNLLVQLSDRFDYLPFFGWNGVMINQETLQRLLTDPQLRDRLFSENTQQLINKLRSISYYRFNPEQVEVLINLPSEFPDFIGKLRNKYNYYFRENDFGLLSNLYGDKENLYKMLDGLVGSGYALDLKDLDNLTPLVGLADKLPALLADLKDVLGYKFDSKDTQLLATLAGGNFSKERLTSLKGLFERYKNQWNGGFRLHWIQRVSVLENSESVIRQLEENTGHKFTLDDTESLRFLVNAPDKDKVFAVLGVLQSKFSMQFQMANMSLYVSLSNFPDLGRKLDEAAMALPPGELNNANNLRLFASLGGEVSLYNHAQKLISDDYFRGIRDAKNRIGQFMGSIYRGEISDIAVARVFAVSTKATELDRLALKLGINAEIARAANREDWYTSLLQASNFQEANEGLTRLMTELALPVVYADLQGEEFTQKQNTLVELASKDREFGDILEICCRSVGIYGNKYPNRGVEFTTLMGAIRQSLDLNLERNPRAYLQRRTELSAHQFDRIFEGFPQEVRDRVMQTWLDLSSKRRLRVSGEVITAEEATLSRLNRIRDLVQTDLSVHLQALFMAKIGELETVTGRGEANGPGAEQLAIYKQYLLTPTGAIRQDIPRMYRSIETFVRSGQQTLKNPNTPKEEKAKLGKSVGTYQAISDSLKALYRLGTISEERYKARRDYLNELDKNIGEFSGALKRLRILDPERRSTDVNMSALEEEVLLDLGKLRGTMSEENVAGQTIFETESTVAFRDLARAPEMTQSCQRLTEVTGYNQAAYSRLVDGSNEMIDVYELRNGEKNRLARSFIELSKVNITGEEQPRLTILIDREYVNPQYQNFSLQFSTEMVAHMIDRIGGAPEVSLLFDSDRIAPTEQIAELLRQRGYQMRQVSGEYFINESNVKLAKYYDSLGGVTNVAQPSSRNFRNFYIIERVAAT